jgi:hypothetical protein
MTNQKKYFEGPSCKKCNEILERTKSKPLDKILNLLTLGSFHYKRFHCWGCLDTRLLSKKDYVINKRQII